MAKRNDSIEVFRALLMFGICFLHAVSQGDFTVMRSSGFFARRYAALFSFQDGSVYASALAKFSVFMPWEPMRRWWHLLFRSFKPGLLLHANTF